MVNPPTYVPIYLPIYLRGYNWPTYLFATYLPFLNYLQPYLITSKQTYYLYWNISISNELFQVVIKHDDCIMTP